MGRNSNTDAPQPVGLPALPLVHPSDPLRPEPPKLDHTPQLPDVEPSLPGRVCEPDTLMPASEPQPAELSWLV
ncbi:MAG: hypothetical protein H0T92_01995 [Pyrinomonadaceae bacterium]|nr:hypothetical protein [Pyrinomonadaceae bacterium]